MSKTSIKQLREKAEELAAQGIGNKAALLEALPVLTELQNVARATKTTATACSDVAKILSDMCSEYARGHHSVFDEGLTEERDRVFSGDITIDGTAYHFVSSPGEITRESGDNLTQGFLKQLPESMTSTSIKLKAGKATDAELAEHGLVRGEKGTWSMPE